MTTINYFKLQAKNLHKDFKTQKTYFDPNYGRNLYEYAPTFFDVDALALDFDIDEDNFTLMNAQHYIAKLAGFKKWAEMLKASPHALELSKLLFDNMHKVSVIEWEIYISIREAENGFIFEDELKLEIFKDVFAKTNGHQSNGYDYRLSKGEEPSNENQLIKHKKTQSNKKNKSVMQISTLPLSKTDLKEFIDVANWKFEELMQMVEPNFPDLVRSLWNPKDYIDEILDPSKLPIDRNYALSLIESFLLHHFIALAAETDEQEMKLN
ncbi:MULTISPECIES: hypothetical protein [unclassified Sphingobacterium]|uniref:hypothetical protein n=1 Tax=unclassified Sphingobacterium TaxID=2609468 RepID=UPI0025F16831|nr:MULTISPECIES: hypothetical protein [unclassified Sphingobacterium]